MTPLLNVMLAGHDATVARVAEVAAGAGGAGAASLSLKAGAAAVLATGALVTGGQQIERVVHPSQRPAKTAAPKASSAAAKPAGASNAAITVPAAKPAADHGTGASSSSGPTHRQRRRGRDGDHAATANKGRREHGKTSSRRG